MKNGTVYAAKLKKVYGKLRKSGSKPELPDPDDPLRRLALAILGVGASDEEAGRAVHRLIDTMVDWNEVRVSSPEEVHRAVGNTIPDGLARCERLIEALQSIYDRENQVSLDHLRSMGRRDARQYLEKLSGVDEYAAASVLLWSLGGHAMPVNDRLLEALREQELVNPTADRAEVQAFLERNVSAAEAREFCLVIQSLCRKGRRTRRTRTKRSATKKKSTPAT